MDVEPLAGAQPALTDRPWFQGGHGAGLGLSLAPLAPAEEP